MSQPPTPSLTRLSEDLALTIKYQVPIVITTLGITPDVTDAIHSYGGLVFHDAINVRHAQRALEMNVDGIIAVSGGAGGHAGTYNPFPFLGELKPLVGDKTLILSGCVTGGASIAGAVAAGADLAYLGTRFINTRESLASEQMKQLVIDSDITDIVYSAEVDGMGANWLRQTLPDRNMPAGEKKECLDIASLFAELKRWRDILSAGQGVGSIHDTPSVAELIERLSQEFLAAAKRLQEVVAGKSNDRT